MSNLESLVNDGQLGNVVSQVKSPTAEQLTPEQEPQVSFSIPDEYKNKGWAQNLSKYQGEDLMKEVMKSLDNAHSFTGKRVEDFLKTNDISKLDNYAEIKGALSPHFKDMPVSVPDSYNFAEIGKSLMGADVDVNPEVAEILTGIFKEGGVKDDIQAGMLISKFMEYEDKLLSERSDPQMLTNELNKIMSPTEQTKVFDAISTNLTQQEADILNSPLIPNEAIVTMAKFAKGLMDKYGYNEASQPGQAPVSQVLDKGKAQDNVDYYYKQLEALKSRPHNSAEKNELLSAYNKSLDDLYKLKNGGLK